MSTDDESKKDEQNASNSAQQQEGEQAPSVSLFPEYSVYDLEPIVIPDNMRLGAQDDEGPVTGENPIIEEAQSEPPVKDQPVSLESEKSDSSAVVEVPEVQSSEVSTDETKPVVVDSTETVLKKNAVPIGSTLGKLKITPRKVRATAQNLKIDEPTNNSAPSERTDEFVQTTSAEPNLYVTAETPAAEQEHNVSEAVQGEEWKEHASAVLEHFGWEQAGWAAQKIGTSEKEANDKIEITSDNRSDSTAVEPSQIEQTQPELNKNEDDDPYAKKNFFPENSAFDLEPIVIPDDQRLGSVTPKPQIDPRTTAQHQKLSPIKIGQHRPTPRKVEPGLAKTIQSPDSSPVAAQAQSNGEAEVSLAQAAITIPSSNGDQHVVISEPVSELATQVPALDPANIEFSEPTTTAVAASDPTACFEVAEPTNQVADVPATVDVEISEPTTDVADTDPTAHVALAEPATDFENADPSVYVEVSAATTDVANAVPTADVGVSEPTTDVANADPSAYVEVSERTTDVADADPSANVEGSEPRSDVAVSDMTAEPTSDLARSDSNSNLVISEPTIDHAHAEEKIDENQKTGWAEEQTGWEEIVDKQERWQEQTGWEEVVEEKSEWERSGWSESDNEQSAESPPSQADSQEISESHSQNSDEEQSPGFMWSADTVDSALPTEQFHPSEVGDTYVDNAAEAQTNIESSGLKKHVSVDALFSDDDEDEDEPASEPSDVTDPAAVGTKTLEIEPTDRQNIEAQIGTTTGENQPSFAPEAEPSEAEENASQPDSGHFPAIVIDEGNKETTPNVVSGQFDVFSGEQSSLDHSNSTDTDQTGNRLDINNLGIGTADIDQIILEHSSVQLTLKSGALEEAEEEERVLRELLLTEQRDAERQAQLKFGIDPQSQSQEITNPELQHASNATSPPDLNVADASSEEPVYDEEDALQEFRPTDSIYELAPFVLPTAGERLTDETDTAGRPVKPRTVQQAVNATAVPERAAVPSYSSDPLVGTTLAHSYEVLDVIGQGGMAIVYRAKQIATGRLVAIKTLKTQNPPDIVRFSQEIKTHSQLDHKNVVDYIDSFNARGQLFLVMERVRGISLEEIIRTFGKLDEPANIVDILSQILDALEYAHSGGLIHRDLKTANVILIKEQDEAMVVKILDFGIAKIQGDLQRLTHVGQALGSPIYMSPEQCSGKTLTTRSDLYSLGVVAYETVTGTPPYSKGTLINVMAAHCNENIRPKPLSEMAPHLPKFKMLDQILQKALQTPAEKRWQSAKEFRTALQFWQRSVEIDAPYDELPVELMRSPVTELDLDKLVVSASTNTSPSKPTQPSFTWAQEPAPASNVVADQGFTTGENVGWASEEQHEDIWPEQQGGWTEGTKPVESVPGWGEEAASATDEPWGGSEKHRLSDAQESPPSSTPVADSQNQSAKTSDSYQAIPDPNQKLFQSNYQAETSDLWNAQQNQVNQRRSSVRDLLASPTGPKEDPNPSEVRTSVEINAVGTSTPAPGAQLINQTATPEFKSMLGNESSPAVIAPESSTAGGASSVDVPAEPIDLRRRQTPAQPLRTATNNVLYIVIGIVIGLLFTALFGYYFFIQTDTFHLRPAPPEKKKIDPFLDPNLTGPVPNNKEPEKQSEQNERSSSDAVPSPSADTSESTDKANTTDSSDATTPDANETATPETAKPEASTTDVDSKPPDVDSKPPDVYSPSSVNIDPTTSEPNKDAPTPFKKGEPEEGVDF